MPTKPIALTIHEKEKGKLYGELAERARHEPKPLEKLEPRLPRQFGAAEKRYWKFYGDIARNYGLFVIANAPALERLARNTALLEECRKAVKKVGMWETLASGKKRRTAEFAQYLRLQEEIRKDEDRIGANTQAMAKVGLSMARAKKKEGIEELLD